MVETRGRFDLRTSPTAAAWLAVVHAGGVLAVWTSAVPPVATGGLAVLAALSFVRALRLHALRSARNAVVRLELGRTLRLTFADGRESPAKLRAKPLVHCRLVVIRLAWEGGRTVVLVPPDALRTHADHKALRRGLRHGVAQ